MLTVQSVLDIDVLQAGGVTVVAGAEQLGREVRWVHAGEIGDIAAFLRGGELLLTAGTGVGSAPEQQRAYVQALERVGASALVLELVRSFAAAPEALCDEAERLGLPVATLDREVPFADVTRRVHALILDRQHELLEKAELIGREFTDLLLRGGGLEHVVSALAGIVGNPVVVEDRARQIVEVDVHRSEPGRFLAAWPAHARRGHQDASSGGVVVEADTEPPCCWTPIIVHGALWGRLHVLATARPLDAIDQVAIDRAGAAIGLALLAERDPRHPADQARALLLADVEGRRITSSGAFLERARSLGADLAGRTLTAVVVASAHASSSTAIAAAARAAAHDLRCGLLSVVSSGSVRMIVGTPVEADADGALGAIADAAIAASAEAAQVVVGISRPATVERLSFAFAEADECVRYARIRGQQGVHAYNSLGLHLVLVSALERGELAPLVETELGRLLEHDGQGRAALLPTLRAMVEVGGNKSRAAALLHVQRRSLYFRLERIERLIDRRVDDGEDLATLAVALHGLDLLRDRAGQRGGASYPTDAVREP